MKKFLPVLLLAILTWQPLKAQTAHEMGFGLGVMNYKGEMSELPNFATPRLGATFFYRANFTQAWSMRVGVVYGEVKQSDANSKDAFAAQRKHQFQTSIIELSARAEYNFFDLSADKKAPSLWTPYIFAGAGYFFMSSKTNIQPTYELNSFAIPFGVGVKFLLNDRWNLNFEFGARKTFTDYIDDLGSEVNVNRSAGNRDARYYTGNPHDNDLYFYTGISIGLYLTPFEHPCPIQVSPY